MTLRQAFLPITLRATNLTGQRGESVLFSGLDFTVSPGELLALRGANGAGKTTLLMLLYGALHPATGSIVFDGADPEAGPIRHLFGHQSAVKPRLSVRENLDFWIALNGGERNFAVPALETVGLAPIARLDAGYLSAGQIRRLALARLLVSPRPVWLLDEPTAALDAEGDGLVGRLIANHLDAGGLAVAATHLPLAIPESRLKNLRFGA